MPCEPCNQNCIHYVTTPIDIPESVSDYREIAWMLSHQNVQVFVDVSGDEEEWYLQFQTQSLIAAAENPYAHESQRSQASNGEIPLKEAEAEEKSYVFSSVQHFQEWAKENPPLSDEEADALEEDDDDDEDYDDDEEEEQPSEQPVPPSPQPPSFQPPTGF